MVATSGMVETTGRGGIKRTTTDRVEDGEVATRAEEAMEEEEEGTETKAKDTEDTTRGMETKGLVGEVMVEVVAVAGVDTRAGVGIKEVEDTREVVAGVATKAVTSNRTGMGVTVGAGSKEEVDNRGSGRIIDFNVGILRGREGG